MFIKDNGNAQTKLPDCLGNEIADNTPIINIHARSIGVENPSNPNLCHWIITTG